MNGNQLRQILMHDEFTRNGFMGVYASDQIPLNYIPARRPVMFVANTAPSNHPGQHWVAFFYPTTGSPEFFDSFGKSPSYDRFTFQPFKYNKKGLQSFDSDVCGYYVLLYLLQRSRGITMQEITSQFTNNRDCNDLAVTHFMEGYNLK